MGLKYPGDLESWQQWSEKQNLARYVKHRIHCKRELSELKSVVLMGKDSQNPTVLVALESTSPTQIAALLLPGERLAEQGFAVGVLAEAEHQGFLEERGYFLQENFTLDFSKPTSFLDVQHVIAVGHYLPIGARCYEQSQRHDWQFNVIQHGINTPFVPPLPANSTLFAFSEADAEFWKSGRTDVTHHVVGSQMFYEAAKKPKVVSENIAEQPVFLGQMHGAELPRPSFARASYKFCKDHQAIYRPHPSERDRLSTITHKLWAKQGIEVGHSAVPLNELNNPVVSVFSTGVLEAAMRGISAWVYHPNPPEWLLEFWNRYGMHQWGSEPTPAPTVPECEPAQEIARLIATTLEN